MTVWTIGLNHHTAPVDVRGRFAFALDQIGQRLDHLRSAVSPHLEAAILSTCNRTEMYCSGGSEHMPQTLDWLAQAGGVEAHALRAYSYSHQDEHAARHAFRVASGLNSMVLGEPQILGQMKDAVRAASDAGALGTTLNQLFQRSFSVAKEVRSTTEIGAHSISMAAAAVRLAGQLFENLGSTRVLFVGAGEMIELCATHFAAKKPLAMVISNRTRARGEQLAAQFGAQVMALSELPDRLHEFDIVVSCTASTLPIIGLGAVERALKKRKRRPMFLVDLAVPRDIEMEVKSLNDAYLYTVDDLAHVVKAGQEQRHAAVAQAETIIDGGVKAFSHWLDQRGTVPLIKQVQEQTDQWRRAELARALKQLERGEDAATVLETMSRGLTQKMLHGALHELRSAETEARTQACGSVQRFFLGRRR
jgi:glutamyl-tRNA reductase